MFDAEQKLNVIGEHNVTIKFSWSELGMHHDSTHKEVMEYNDCARADTVVISSSYTVHMCQCQSYIK